MNDVKALARQLAAHGRHGDTMLAHINPEEAALLKAMGGSGTINPATGLPEYFSLGKVFKNVAHAVQKIPVVGSITKPLTNQLSGFGTAIDNPLKQIKNIRNDKAINRFVPAVAFTHGLKPGLQASARAAALGALAAGGAGLAGAGPLAGLGSLLGIGSGSGGATTLGSVLGSRGFSTLANLGLGALGARQQRKTDENYAAGLQSLAAPARQAGEQMLAQYQSGQPNVGDQQSINDYVANAKAQIQQQFANSGLSNSSILADRLAEVDKHAAQLRSQAVQGYFQQGINALSSTYNPYTQALQARYAADTNSQQAIVDLVKDIDPNIFGDTPAAPTSGATGGALAQGDASLPSGYTEQGWAE